MKLSVSNKRRIYNAQKSQSPAFLFPSFSFTCYFSLNLPSLTLQRWVNLLFFFDSIYTFLFLASKLCIFDICFYLHDHLSQWKLSCSSSFPQSFGVFLLTRWQRFYYAFSLPRCSRWALHIVLLMSSFCLFILSAVNFSSFGPSNLPKKQ